MPLWQWHAVIVIWNVYISICGFATLSFQSHTVTWDHSHFLWSVLYCAHSFHWFRMQIRLTSCEHASKENSGIFQPGVFPINVAIEILLKMLTLYSPPLLLRFRETRTHAKQRISELCEPPAVFQINLIFTWIVSQTITNYIRIYVHLLLMFSSSRTPMCHSENFWPVKTASQPE